MYMLLFTMPPSIILYFLGIKRFGLERKLNSIIPSIFWLAIIGYVVGEILV